MAMKHIALTLALLAALVCGVPAAAGASDGADLRIAPDGAAWNAPRAKAAAEGEGEGDGEGETPAAISEITLLRPSGDIATSPGVPQVPVLFCAEVTLSEEAEEDAAPVVVFEWNGSELPATERDGLYWAQSVAPAGFESTVTVVATLEGDETEYTSDPYTFSVRAAADDDANGYPDDPFTALAKPGDSWYGLHILDDCVRVVGMLELEALAPECLLILSNPYDAANTATVSVPGAILGTADRGILTAALSCNENGMFAPDAPGPDAALRPGDPLEGGGFLFAGVVVTSDDGATFGDPDAYYADRNALTFNVAGLDTKPGYVAAWHAFPALLDSDPAAGFRLVPAGSAWDRSSVLTVGEKDGVFSGRMQRAQLVAPFQTGLPARLEIPEAAGGSVSFGRIQVGKTGSLVLTLQNPGSAPVTGAVALSDPAGVFVVKGAASYTVPAGGEIAMEIQFVPAAEEDYRAELAFTGGAAPITVSVLGSGTSEVKTVSLFGCAPAGGRTVLGWGDLVILVAMVFGGLLRFRRAVR